MIITFATKRNPSIPEASHWNEGCFARHILVLHILINIWCISIIFNIFHRHLLVLHPRESRYCIIYQDDELLQIFGWMVAINPVGQVALFVHFYQSDQCLVLSVILSMCNAFEFRSYLLIGDSLFRWFSPQFLGGCPTNLAALGKFFCLQALTKH